MDKKKRKTFGNYMIDSRDEAKEQIRLFYEEYPKSKKKFKIVKRIYYQIEDEIE